MKKFFVTMLCMFLTICMLCSIAFADGAEEICAALDAAFAGDGVMRLVPVSLEQINPEGDRLLAISPDGSTVIQGTEIRSRDGKVIPITVNLERGIGDPYRKEKYLRNLSMKMPGQEGVSWSEDGRYIALSDFQRSSGEMQSIDVAVLDVFTGEAYFADSFSRKMSEPGMGLVYLNRIERTGKYLYYLAVIRDGEGKRHLSFCRCPVEGGEREILYDTLNDENGDFDVCYGSSLYEAEDGSWILAGLNRHNRERKSQLALIRFRDSGNGWTAEVNSLGIPSSPWSLSLKDWSPATGYGLFCLKYPTMDASAAAEGFMVPQSEYATLVEGMARRVNLLRVHTDGEVSGDVWYMIRTGEGKADVELLPATDYLNSCKLNGAGYDESEEAGLQEWLSENGNQDEPLYALPKGYDSSKFIEEYNQLLTVTCAAVSPDGHYAIINAGVMGQYELYIVQMETMEVRPVDAPEGVAGLTLTDSAMGRRFRPGIVWNDDGTLLIEGQSGDYAGVRPFVLEVE